MRPYIYAALIFSLAAGVLKAYDAGGDARENEIRIEFAKIREARDAEISKLQSEISAQRAVAENKIVEQRIIYRDRIKTIERSTDNCVIPADILRVLSDAGIYTGEI